MNEPADMFSFVKWIRFIILIISLNLLLTFFLTFSLVVHKWGPEQLSSRINQMTSFMPFAWRAYITTDHPVAMAGHAQKGVAWELLTGVRSEGQKGKGHQQLDSAQEEQRLRKEHGGGHHQWVSGLNSALTLNWVVTKGWRWPFAQNLHCPGCLADKRYNIEDLHV